MRRPFDRFARSRLQHMSLLRAACVELLSSHYLQVAAHVALANVRRPLGRFARSYPQHTFFSNVRRPFGRIAHICLRHTCGGSKSNGTSVATMPNYWTEKAHRVAHRWEAGGLKRTRFLLSVRTRVVEELQKL